jgi:putative redox protein
MIIKVKTVDENYAMLASNEDGNTMLMDASAEIGGQGKGMRPTQLLLAALGGCSMIDVLMILRKQRQDVKTVEVEVDGDREKVEEYSLFRNIVLNFKITGNVDADKADRAVRLSLDKYCSVSKTLEPTAKINYRITLNP